MVSKIANFFNPEKIFAVFYFSPNFNWNYEKKDGEKNENPGLHHFFSNFYLLKFS